GGGSFTRQSCFIRENGDENADEISGDRGAFVSFDDRPSPCAGLLHVSGVGPAERPGPDHVHRGGLRFSRQHRVSGDCVDLSALFEVCQRPGPNRTTCEKRPHLRGRAPRFAKKTGASRADQLSDRALRRAPELRRPFRGGKVGAPRPGGRPAPRPHACPATPRHARAARIYSTTSSAVASSLSGILRPSAFAVLRLTASSYLIGFCTGRL